MQRTYRLAGRTPFFYGWVIVLVAALNMFAGNVLGSATISVFIRPMGDEFGWSRTLISGAVFLGNVAVILVSPLAGRLVDRRGPRLVLTVSSLIMGGSAIGLSWVNSPLAFYLAYGPGRAVFFGAVQVAATTAVANWFIRRRGQATSWVFVGAAGSFFALPILAQLVINSWGWRAAWLVLGILVLVLTLLPSLFLLIRRPEDVGQRPDGAALQPAEGVPDSSGSEAGEPAWALSEAVRTPTLWLLSVAFSVLLMAQGGIVVHQAPYLVSRGLSPTVAAAALSTFGIFMGMSTLVWGYLADRMPIKWAFTGTAAGFAVAIGLLLAVNSPLAAFLVVFIQGAFFGGVGILMPVMYANYFGRRSLGSIRGFTQPMIVLGQATGILLSGIIFDAVGSYLIAFVIFGVLAVGAAGCAMAARPPVRGAVPRPV